MKINLACDQMPIIKAELLKIFLETQAKPRQRRFARIAKSLQILLNCPPIESLALSITRTGLPEIVIESAGKNPIISAINLETENAIHSANLHNDADNVPGDDTPI